VRSDNNVYTVRIGGGSGNVRGAGERVEHTGRNRIASDYSDKSEGKSLSGDRKS
jgi:hypothetical protein